MIISMNQVITRPFTIQFETSFLFFSSFYSIQIGLLKLSHLHDCGHTLCPLLDTDSSLLHSVPFQDQLWFCFFHEILLDNSSLKNPPSFEFQVLIHPINIY